MDGFNGNSGVSTLDLLLGLQNQAMQNAYTGQVGQMPVGQMGYGQMPVGQIPVGQMGYPQSMYGQMGYGQIPVQQNINYNQMFSPQMQPEVPSVMPLQQQTFSYDRYGQIKFKVSDGINLLTQDILRRTGSYPNKVVKIAESPDLLRHACVDCGISKLPRYNFPIPEANFNISFWYCTACKTLYIPGDLIY